MVINNARSIHRRVAKRRPIPEPEPELDAYARDLLPRFSPTWTGQGNTPGATAVVPNQPIPPTPSVLQPTLPSIPVETQPPTQQQPSQVIQPTVTAASNPLQQTPASVEPVAPTSDTSSQPTSTTTTPSASPTNSVTVDTPTVPSPVVTAPVVTHNTVPLTTAIPSPSTIIVQETAAISSAIPSASSTAVASNALSTGSIVGIAAAGLVAVGVCITVGLWLARRYFGKRDEENFARNSFMRQSVHLSDEASPDDPSHPSFFSRPRPPTMIERHYGAAGVGAHGNISNNNTYTNPISPSYGPVDGFHPNNMTSPMGSANPFLTPLDSPTSAEYQDLDHRYPGHAPASPAAGAAGMGGPQRYYTRSPPSNAGPNTRAITPPDQGQIMRNGPPSQPRTMIQSPYQPEPDDVGFNPEGNYADLQRASVTPYQAEQYAEISRQLNIASVANTPISPSFPKSPLSFSLADTKFESASQLMVVDDGLPTPPPVYSENRVKSRPPVLPDVALARAMSPVTLGPYSFPMPSPLAPGMNGMGKPGSPPAHVITYPHLDGPVPVHGNGNGGGVTFRPPTSPTSMSGNAQLVSVPENAYAGKETPVQYGFNEISEHDGVSMHKKVSVRKPVPAGRPETLYDTDDAYGGI